MKKSLIFLAFTLICYAGDDVEPAVAPIAEPVPTYENVDKSGFYLGGGISGMRLENELSDEEFSATGMMLMAGYQYNQYIAIEGRYSVNISDVEYEHGKTFNQDFDDYPTDFSNTAIYLKPIYPIGDFSLYGLLGYGETKLTNLPLGGSGISADRAEDGFQWGVGASYNFNNNIALFIDYVRMYDDEGFDYRAIDADIISDAYTFGIYYKF